MQIPETKPPTELINGRLVQKKGGEHRHQALEQRWTSALGQWCAGCGVACHDWQHEFAAPGQRFAVLVPDIAYQSAEALKELGPAASEAPTRAPVVAVEILCIGESEPDLAWKIGAYLASGTRVVTPRCRSSRSRSTPCSTDSTLAEARAAGLALLRELWA